MYRCGPWRGPVLAGSAEDFLIVHDLRAARGETDRMRKPCAELRGSEWPSAIQRCSSRARASVATLRAGALYAKVSKSHRIAVSVTWRRARRRERTVGGTHGVADELAERIDVTPSTATTAIASSVAFDRIPRDASAKRWRARAEGGTVTGGSSSSGP